MSDLDFKEGDLVRVTHEHWSLRPNEIFRVNSWHSGGLTVDAELDEDEQHGQDPEREFGELRTTAISGTRDKNITWYVADLFAEKL
jgi:hypothetical protein